MPQTSKKLNLGCGVDIKSDYCNIDISFYQGVDIVTDLENGLPMFDNDSIEEIYSSHSLEHLSFDGSANLIKECYRILRTDGILYIIVPDLLDACKRFIDSPESNKYSWPYEYIYGAQINVKNRGQQNHLCGFTVYKLKEIVEKNNFK